ncbi:hypothetical protein L6452_11877 [Arctium lappa]|uniref:Uncharacterized protein n=1 Tax=Arctium lappa TaxID=4217 RepID=A0ACB9DQQ5_ARCLA|nr:hypothetical protein L6452_11877 [Arctium lappa]
MDHDCREERLSFSDLRFSSDDLQVDSKIFSDDENQSYISSSSSSFNQDFLGFFSEEWSTTSTSISSDTPDGIIFCGKVIQTSTNIKTDSRKNKNNYDSKSSSYTPRSSSLSGKKKDDGYKNDVLAQSKILACGSSTKSRWQVFLFGSDRFPTKMELSDIRSRQLRRCYGGEEKKSGGKRLWELIRVLGCVGVVDSTMMKR